MSNHKASALSRGATDMLERRRGGRRIPPGNRPMGLVPATHHWIARPKPSPFRKGEGRDQRDLITAPKPMSATEPE